MTKHSLIAGILATAALAAGCGDGYGDQNATSKPAAAAYGYGEADATPAAPKRATVARPPVAKTAGKVVELSNTTFQPSAVDVKVGETVTFVNKDAIDHTATAQAGAKFDSGTLAEGAKFAFVADKAGKISYLCAFHPGMTGTITVT